MIFKRKIIRTLPFKKYCVYVCVLRNMIVDLKIIQFQFYIEYCKFKKNYKNPTFLKILHYTIFQKLKNLF